MVGSACGGVFTNQTDLANDKVGEGFDKEGRNNEGWGSNLD